MSQLASYLQRKFYRASEHPYREFERQVDTIVAEGVNTLLDAGCGRTMPVLQTYRGRVKRLIGVELVDFTDVPPDIEAHNANLSHLPLPSSSVDLIISRSVFEHLVDPAAVYCEFYRVLRPGGRVVFLTANMWDYGTLVARMIPNRFHAKIVKRVEGRAEEDTFPTAYKTNTRSAVDRLARDSGLAVCRFEYLSQYPNYLMFNGVLFFAGIVYEKLISRYHSLRMFRGWILVTLERPVLPESDLAPPSSTPSAVSV